MESSIKHKTNQLELPGNTESSPFKVFTAVVSQSGTNAPVITVLENTLGATVAPSRLSTGQYFLTFSQDLISTKGYFSIVNGARPVVGQTPAVRFGIDCASNSIALSSSIYSPSLNLYELSDGLFDEISIEARVYN